jgi:hypothetical protein
LTNKPGTIVAVISDTHVGGTTAISPLKFAIHSDRPKETQTVEASAAQRWLYEAMQDYKQAVMTAAGVRGKYRKHRVIVFHLGDVVDGLHHDTPQVMNETSDQIWAACDLLRPFAALADGGMWITYGTGAHTGGTAEHEVTVGRELGVHHDWEFSLDVDGSVFDITHHGRAGQRDWTGSAANLAVEVARDYQKDGKPAPRYVLRGHTHKVDDTGWKLPDTRAIVLPSWQLRTAYSHKAAANQKRADIGGVIFDTTDIDNPRLLRYVAPGGFIHVEKV